MASHHQFARVVLCITVFITAAVGLPAQDEARGNVIQTENDLLDAVYTDCLRKDSMACVKYKVFNFVDKALGHRDTITVTEGVQFVKTGDKDGAPRAISADDTIESMVFSRLADFLDTHSLKVDIKGSEIVSSARSLSESLADKENLIEGAEESRRKKMKGNKMMGPILGALALKMAVLGKLALAAIALIAGKALIIGKIALVLSAIIGIKKLLGNGSGQKHVTYEVVPHAAHSTSHEAAYGGGGSSGHGGGYGGDLGYSGGSSAGWGRSVDAQDLAYSGYAQQA